MEAAPRLCNAFVTPKPPGLYFASDMEQSKRYLVSCSNRSLRNLFASPRIWRLLRWHINSIRHVRISRGTALRSGDDSSKKPGTARTVGTGAKAQGKDRDMGAALRTVYQRTVEEAIPPEMLDLLGKLD